jgi:glycosyltransferase involved in cell wall biosynthesis
VYYLLRTLGQVHEVTLFSFAFGTARPDQADELNQLCVDVQTVTINPFEANQTGNIQRFLSPEPVVTRPLPDMSQLVRQALADKTFDAVICSTEVTAAYALQMPPGTAKILEEHNSLARWMWEHHIEQRSTIQKMRCWVSWQKTRRFESRLFDKFDLVTMVSEQDRKFSQYELPGYRGWVEVVPNGVDCQHNRPGLVEPQPRTLVYNGSLTYSANYDAMRFFLTEIHPRIKAEVPDASLTITGSTTGANLTGLALDDSVRLTGYVDDVRYPVAGASVCVTPIRQGGGTRLKILEAMALGTPVVATSKGAEGLDVVDGEHLLLADDPETFARRTVELMQNPILRHQLTINARRLVEDNYDWRQIGSQFVTLVEDVVERRGVS